MNRAALVSSLFTVLVPVFVIAQDRPKPLTPRPAASPEDSIRPALPPIPEPPAEPLPARAAAEPEPSPAANIRLPAAPTDDPFQQAPRDRDELSRASAAFAARRYAQAATLFGEADRRKERFTDAQREEWAYCRLHAVATQLNGESPVQPATLRQEVEGAMKVASARLRPFGDQLLAEIDRRGPATSSNPIEPGWQVIQTSSFRVMHKSMAELAAEVSRTAESARKDMYERWAGPAGGNWSPRCDIYLHATGSDYARATRKPPEQWGHSTVGTRAGRVVSRRIDLRADEPSLLDGSLPSEVTQVLVADLFADQPIPRWARIGMAALSESPERVARYHRAVPGLLREKKLFAVGSFLESADFPEPDSITPFYAESVSLVSFLVELRGPKAFTAFLREAPRRGYTKALSTHYGFKDAADLQDRWVKHALGAE